MAMRIDDLRKGATRKQTTSQVEKVKKQAKEEPKEILRAEPAKPKALKRAAQNGAPRADISFPMRKITPPPAQDAAAWLQPGKPAWSPNPAQDDDAWLRPAAPPPRTMGLGSEREPEPAPQRKPAPNKLSPYGEELQIPTRMDKRWPPVNAEGEIDREYSGTRKVMRDFYANEDRYKRMALKNPDYITGSVEEVDPDSLKKRGRGALLANTMLYDAGGLDVDLLAGVKDADEDGRKTVGEVSKPAAGYAERWKRVTGKALEKDDPYVPYRISVLDQLGVKLPEEFDPWDINSDSVYVVTQALDEVQSGQVLSGPGDSYLNPRMQMDKELGDRGVAFSKALSNAPVVTKAAGLVNRVKHKYFEMSSDQRTDLVLSIAAQVAKVDPSNLLMLDAPTAEVLAEGSPYARAGESGVDLSVLNAGEDARNKELFAIADEVQGYMEGVPEDQILPTLRANATEIAKRYEGVSAKEFKAFIDRLMNAPQEAKKAEESKSKGLKNPRGTDAYRDRIGAILAGREPAAAGPEESDLFGVNDAFNEAGGLNDEKEE